MANSATAITKMTSITSTSQPNTCLSLSENSLILAKVYCLHSLSNIAGFIIHSYLKSYYFIQQQGKSLYLDNNSVSGYLLGLSLEFITPDVDAEFHCQVPSVECFALTEFEIPPLYDSPHLPLY